MEKKNTTHARGKRNVARICRALRRPVARGTQKRQKKKLKKKANIYIKINKQTAAKAAGKRLTNCLND